MNIVEINLSGAEEENVKSFCKTLSRRFLGCTLYRTIGYWSEDSYKSSYDGIKEIKGYGIKVLTEEEIDQVEKVIRTYLSGTNIQRVQVVSYKVDANHVDLGGVKERVFI